MKAEENSWEAAEEYETDKMLLENMKRQQHEDAVAAVPGVQSLM